MAVSVFMELCGAITTFTLNRINNQNLKIAPGGQIYVEYAKQYIHKHYKKIYIKNIASELRISDGYLQSIFKLGVGMSIIEYYNRYRINMARQYIDHYGVSLKKAAESVGIADV